MSTTPISALGRRFDARTLLWFGLRLCTIHAYNCIQSTGEHGLPSQENEARAELSLSVSRDAFWLASLSSAPISSVFGTTWCERAHAPRFPANGRPGGISDCRCNAQASDANPDAAYKQQGLVHSFQAAEDTLHSPAWEEKPHGEAVTARGP